MSKPNLALNIVLVILGLLILALMVGLTGCDRYHNREYERPRCHFHCPCEDFDYCNRRMMLSYGCNRAM